LVGWFGLEDKQLSTSLLTATNDDNKTSSQAGGWTYDGTTNTN
jgi:hypothetical protein